MTRLSATATIAALLLLAMAQGFGATTSKSTTKSSPKIASKSTAKPYHVTAQNQFHFKSKKLAAAKVRSMTRPTPKLIGPQITDKPNGAMLHMPAITHAHAIKPRRNQANPPTGKIGFVSATQVPAGGYLGDTDNQVLVGTLGGATALISVVENPAGSFWYSEVVANGDGTFGTPVLTTPVPGNESQPFFVVGDVNGDGNSDIIQADNPGTITVLLSNSDGTFSPAPIGTGPASPFTLGATTGITGGTLVPNASSGFLDLVMVDDSVPSLVSTYAGNGDGTFGSAVTVPVAAATSVALAPTGSATGVGFNVIIMDLDGDGTVDVAENDNSFPYEQNVYLFATATTPYTGAQLTTPTSASGGGDDACTSTAGSLTGSSGSPAIIEVNCDDQTITVYNNAAGVFSEGVFYPALVTPTTTAFVFPESATIADVNGDGNGDVVLSDYYAGAVTVLLGNGDGTLQTTSVSYGTGGTPYEPAIVTDLNGDGLADILVADNNFSLSWMAGYGDGTFQASKVYYAPVPDSGVGNGITLASGDFNGDGFADLVVANCCDTTIGITVYLSNPDGSLQPGVNYGTGGGMEFATVADFNGDGNLDIAASDFQNGVVRIFTGTGNGNFIEGPQYSTGGSSPAGIIAADIDQANGTDLAVVDGNNALVSILFNDGTGGFSAPVTYPLTNSGLTLAATDLNGDTTPDLVISESGGTQVGVLLNGVSPNLVGTFGAETTLALGDEPLGLAVADVNGDGFADIVTVLEHSQQVAVIFGNGDGTFTLSATNPILLATSLEDPTFIFTEPETFFVQITDVDGDLVPDLVYANAAYGTVGVLFGTGSGSSGATPAPFFFDPVEFPATGFNIGVAVADLNGDGAPDAATAAEEGAHSAVLINANGTGAAPNFSLSSNPSILNISDGATGTAAITLTPINFYSGTVTFSCGGLPLDVTCAFAPATLTPLGNAPLTTTVTITTAAPHGALRMPADANPHQGRTSLLACLTGMGLFGLLLSGDWKNKRNRRVGILLGILVLGMMFSLVGCSSSSTPGTPIGAQTIQVTGTGSDGTTQAASITINVF